jgi:uncharacterized membrane protein
MIVLARRQPGLLQRRGLIADIVLAGLLLGPLAAPLLQAWGLLVPHAVSGIIYTMGGFVCPQPASSAILYDGRMMAVCMRCYGALLGLLLTRLLYLAHGGTGRLWLPQYQLRGLPIFGALIFAYAAEYAGQLAGLWHFDQLIVTSAGLLTGVGLGLMFHPLLQAQKIQHSRDRVSRAG